LNNTKSTNYKAAAYGGVKFTGDLPMDIIKIFKVHPETLKAAL